VNIKFGTKFIKALCDVFKKIAQTRRFYFEKCHLEEAEENKNRNIFWKIKLTFLKCKIFRSTSQIKKSSV
jgi:hypothetical protein